MTSDAGPYSLSNLGRLHLQRDTAACPLHLNARRKPLDSASCAVEQYSSPLFFSTFTLSYCWSKGRWYILDPSIRDTLHFIDGYDSSNLKFSLISIPNCDANRCANGDNWVVVQKVPLTLLPGFSSLYWNTVPKN